MLFPHPHTLPQKMANIVGLVLVGGLFVATGLNAASGCGDGGECIAAGDFTRGQPPVQAHAAPERIAALP